MCGAVVDSGALQVIRRLLMDDPVDPFTREPLTEEQLVPDTELKSRIDAFLAERGSAAAAPAAAPAASADDETYWD